jgi:hypothetical protein
MNPFCAGHSLLANGSIFVAGGDNQSSSDMTFVGPAQPGQYVKLTKALWMEELEGGYSLHALEMAAQLEPGQIYRQ